MVQSSYIDHYMLLDALFTNVSAAERSKKSFLNF